MLEIIITISSFVIWFIYAVLAFNIAYILFFTLCSLFYRPFRKKECSPTSSFLILLPAYNEDSVIIDSVTSAFNQNYPKELFDVAVISDHMCKETDEKIVSAGAICINATYTDSSKAKALQLAMEYFKNSTHNYVVILDADNRVSTDFLLKLNTFCKYSSPIAVQCHRTSLKAHSEVQQLDSISEEINNTIFRRGHVAVNVSSALIGSGMCFERKWFDEHVSLLLTAGEDKELEKLLLQEKHFIHYAHHICVFDQKTSQSQNFQNQRKRWMAAQIHSLGAMLCDFMPELFRLNIGYIDKTIQQALIPRSFLIVLMTFFSLVISFFYREIIYPWLLLDLMLIVALILSIPRSFYNVKMLLAVLRLPYLVFLMIMNLFRLGDAAKKFIHTNHEKE